VLKEAQDKLSATAPAKDEVAGWFTIRTTFDDVKDAEQLFKPERDESADVSDKASGTATPSSTTGKKQTTLAGLALGTYRSLSRANAATSPRNCFLIRLKGSVLFVYRAPEGYKPTTAVPDKDDPSFECVGAVSVDQHTVTVEDGDGPWKGIEGRVFNKRNAIVLRPVKSKDGKKKGPAVVSKMADMTPEESLAQESKAIFMFSKTNLLTEDMYLALLRASARPPSFDEVFSRPHLKWLIDEVYSMTDPSGLGWFNAFAGRIFLGINQTALIEHFIIDKINKKLALAKNHMINKIEATKADVGHIPPLFSNAMLKRTELFGEIAFQAHMTYRQAPNLPHSGVRITIEADIGIKIVLSLRIKSIEGDVEVKIKQAPTDRFWWGFVEPPKMEMEIVPVVASRTLNLTMLTNFIEKKLREGLAESVVLPNMDDVPFFNTEGMSVRGGIFDEAKTFTGKDSQDGSEERIAKLVGKVENADGEKVKVKTANDEDDEDETESVASTDDLLETNAVVRSETMPASLMDRIRTTSTMRPSQLRTSVGSTKSVHSARSGTSDAWNDARSSDFGTTSFGSVETTATSIEANGTAAAKDKDEPATTPDDASSTNSRTVKPSAILASVRSGDKTALKSQANVVKETLNKRWGNFVSKRRPKGDEDEDDAASTASGSASAPAGTPPKTAKAALSYYAPSPVSATPGRAAMTLQERLAAAAQASKPTHARAPSNASNASNASNEPAVDTSSSAPPATIQPAPALALASASAKREEQTRTQSQPISMQPARQMIVPHVPKRPGVATSLSSTTATSTASEPAPIASSVGSTGSAMSSLSALSSSSLPTAMSLSNSPVPRAAPAPPKISRGDSDPISPPTKPTPLPLPVKETVDLDSDEDDVKTPLPRDDTATASVIAN
jgi:hypothetical protein